MPQFEFPLQFKKQYAAPLDVDIVFNTTNDRLTFLTSPIRYAGQIVSDLQTQKCYQLSTDTSSWIEIGGTSLSLLNSLSTNWDSVYTSVKNTSANWDSTYTSVSITSANWDSVYSSVNTASANWDSLYSSVLNTSANWDSTFTSVKNTSANWDSVYTSVSSNSATYATYNYVDTNFLNLTGGIVTGETRINSNLIVETTSLSAALRITQTGTGNALVVEDSDNPDSTPFIITNIGQIIAGNTSLSAIRQSITPGFPDLNNTGVPKIQTFGNNRNNSSIANFRIDDNAGPAAIFLNKARSTPTQSASAIQAFDRLGKISFAGFDGELFCESSLIEVVATSTPSPSSVKSDIRFITANDGLSSLSEKVRFTAAGNVGIGTSKPNESLTVNGSISASNKIYGTIIDWMTLTRGFKTEPTFNSTIAGGDVYNYVYESSPTDKTYYRYIATDGSEDAYYETFSGGNLSNLIAKKKITV